ncbi:hypothetical protein V499_01891 [Pseudogymnoascus sp. VKM F-103]|uniref:Glutamate carboxypeptidase 2 n=1 Tax=Pseudogymnoascus verrucosus TaxID=342668 RepID=A0A2P2SXN8_9PEZI|nr:uncharacterized protein VE01_00283 [Pseudogymnoascus verrucosus]KFY79068.1 hypothetical protein V499_01891 [Pseudogymnoascus sp. VKM F-103]OBU01611.1 hypothetical protein VE01_00283 [Pseudogymnoascus verrucosus]
MPDEKPYKYENLPIPTYDEATSSRSPTPATSRPNEASNNEERQGLLGDEARLPVPTRRIGYRPPPTEDDESRRDSLDSLEFLGSDEGRDSMAAEDAEMRREMDEMEIEEPPAEQSRWGKRISSISQSLHFPFKFRLPKWKFKMPEMDASIFILLARMFALLVVVGLAYLLFMSDFFSNASRRMGGQMFDPGRVREWLQEQIDSEKIRDNLEHLTAYDHLAGTQGDFALSNWIQQQFLNAGLENVVRDRYDVYLNYPKAGGRAVEILNADGSVKWKAKLEEDNVYPEERRQQALAFHGHSKSGHVKGPLIYANFGSREDFKRLKDSGIDTKGAIALVKYYGSQGDRSLKVKAAEQAGFAGCIIYSDPAEDGFVKGKAWPDGRFMPADGVQRGSVSLMSWVIGDVLTPGWASVKGAKRLPVADNPGLNKIPSIPLAWRDAQILLQSLKGHGQAVPPEWKGGVPDVEWWTGDLSSPVVHLKNEQDEVEQQPIWNVIGRIQGVEQSEKSIIIGNHRDAWAYGAADPGSGTAILIEMARIFGELKRHGWRPLRTIEFASWDGEEYNLIGSTEYVENNIDKLRANGVAYINVDVAVSGQDFQASASPAFEEVIRVVMDRINNPVRNGSTLLQLWEESKSKLEGLGAGSDYVAFQDIAGVSSIDIGFSGERFPYHSVYDNFEWMEKFGDPGFLYHHMLCQVWSLLVLEMADNPILPLSMPSYATAIGKYVEDLNQWAGSKGANQAGKPKWDIEPLRAAALKFKGDAERYRSWETYWRNFINNNGGYEQMDVSIIRQSYNNRASDFETLLLDLEVGGGVPGREQFKHVLFAPQAWSGYDESFFPAIRDAIEAGDWKAAEKAVGTAAKLLTIASEQLVEGDL